jgi:hypothetical protein
MRSVVFDLCSETYPPQDERVDPSISTAIGLARQNKHSDVVTEIKKHVKEKKRRLCKMIDIK